MWSIGFGMYRTGAHCKPEELGGGQETIEQKGGGVKFSVCDEQHEHRKGVKLLKEMRADA